MAHKILGIDLGAHTVKITVAQAGFRAATVVDYLEARVPPAASPQTTDGATPDTTLARAARTAIQLLRSRGLEHEVPYVALAGDALSMRLLEFPFQGLKRADLDKAVGAELEAQLPHDLDDLVYDFDVVPREAEPVAEPAEPADPRKPRPAPVVPGGTRVLAAATTRERVAALLAATGEVGIEPHGVIAAPTAYARIAPLLAGLGGEAAKDDGALLIDHGHARTNVCIVKRGKVVYARTLSRGGRHLTQAIAKGWSLSFEDAENAKHSDGFIASQRTPAPSEAWAHISAVLRGELVPLVRDIRQTLAAARAATGVAVSRGVLFGGGGRLQGLPAFLAEELGLPMGTVTVDDLARLAGPGLVGRTLPLDSALLGVGIALEGASGRPAYDLRKGDLAYKADFSFLRKKAGFLTACALLVIAFAAGNAFAGLHKLHKEEALLEEKLRTTTTEIFGAPATLEELEGKVGPKKEESPMPKMTAFDLLVEVNKRLPARTAVKLDVLELEIEPKKIFIRAIADTSATIDEVEKKLREIECVSDIQRGKVDSVADGKQVSYTLNTKCM